jgi:hypothetical protein
MIARVTADGRLLGLDPTDWFVLLSGSALAGLVALIF